MYRYFCIAILILGFATGLSGQKQSPFIKDPKLERIITKGLKYKKQGLFEKALKQFNRVLESSPHYIPAIIQKASVYYELDRIDAAAAELEKTIAIDSSYNLEIYYSLGLIYEKLERRDEALDVYTHYVEKTDQSDRNHKKALKSIERLSFIIQAMDNPVPFDPVDPGPAINSTNLEYLATLNIKGDLMIFTRRINNQEDLYFSNYKDGKWTEAEPITELNTPYNEAAHCISPDGGSLYFTKCEHKNTYGNCDLFVSQKEGPSKWSLPRNLGSVVNSASWDSQPAVSADGNTLYFSSTRSGGYGGRDIWYSSRNREGVWSMPVNAGHKLNTNKDEESPFLHPDGKHLYFMSNGHPGMGGYDLFVSTLEKEGWSKPVNLGYPINTADDEGAIRVAPDGITAFFSSDRPDLSNKETKDLDIYSFTLYPGIRSLPVGYIEGVVSDKESGKALPVTVSVFNNLDREWVSDFKTDQEGRFVLALPPGKNYNLNIDHPGYVYHSENFNLYESEEVHKRDTIYIELVPIQLKRTDANGGQENQEFVLKNVFFESGSSLLDTLLSGIELRNLVKFLDQNKEIEIIIEGHTDNIGSDEDNLLLSENRAIAVRQYLLNSGIASDRVKYLGFGESRPIASNNSEEGRQLNRRTSFKIIEQ